MQPIVGVGNYFEVGCCISVFGKARETLRDICFNPYGIFDGQHVFWNFEKLLNLDRQNVLENEKPWRLDRGSKLLLCVEPLSAEFARAAQQQQQLIAASRRYYFDHGSVIQVKFSVFP